MFDEYIPSVIQVIAGDDYTVFVYFSDGSIKKYDMKPLIQRGGVFRSLDNESVFRDSLTVLNDTVAWDLSGNYDTSTCIDVDPFELYSGESVNDPLESIA